MAKIDYKTIRKMIFHNATREAYRELRESHPSDVVAIYSICYCSEDVDDIQTDCRINSIGFTREFRRPGWSDRQSVTRNFADNTKRGSFR